MSKQNLNEQINRIKQLLNINESSVLEEGNPIMAIIKKLAPALEKKITTELEGALGKKIVDASDIEIEKALKSSTMAATRKELAGVIYAAQKNAIDGVYAKFDMSVPGQAAQAYNELQKDPINLNKTILKDITAEWKAAGKGGSSSVSPTPSPKPNPKPNDPVNTFKIPDIELEIPDFWKMDDKATRSALKNIFPKAASSDLEKIVSNLRNMKLTNQADFDIALKNAVAGFGPQYKDILTKTSTWSKLSSRYATLPKWGKIIFWIAAVPVGYKLLKMVGIPVDKTLGAVIEGWKGIAKDQAASVTGDTTNNNSNSGSQTATYSFDDNGISQYLIKIYPNTPVSAYDLKQVTSPDKVYLVKLKTGSPELKFKYENGNYTEVR